MEEIWKDIPGYEGYYQVSNFGRIKHCAISSKPGTGNYAREERLIHPNKNNLGYYLASLYKGGKRKFMLVHRAVAMAFIPNPRGLPHVNHIDSNPTNNNVLNLEWCTPSQNAKHSYDTNNRRAKMNWKAGGQNHSAKAVCMLDKTNGNIVKTFECIMDAEREMGILNTSIVHCLKGKYKTAGGYKWIYAK